MNSAQTVPIYRKWHYAKQADFVSKTSTKRKSKDAITSGRPVGKRSKSETSLHPTRRKSQSTQLIHRPKGLINTLPCAVNLGHLAPLNQSHSYLENSPSRRDFSSFHSLSPDNELERCRTVFPDIPMKGLVSDNIYATPYVSLGANLQAPVSMTASLEQPTAFPPLTLDSYSAASCMSIGNAGLFNPMQTANHGSFLGAQHKSPIANGLDITTLSSSVPESFPHTSFALERMNTQTSIASPSPTTPSISPANWSFDTFDLELDSHQGGDCLADMTNYTQLINNDESLAGTEAVDFTQLDEITLADIERAFSLQ